MAQTVATLLLVLGVLDVLAALFCLCGGPLGAFAAFTEGDADAPFMLVFYIVYGFVLGALGVLKLTASSRAFQRRGHRLAMAASIACFVNTLICCNVVQLALGLVCVALLSKPEVREEFTA